MRIAYCVLRIGTLGGVAYCVLRIGTLGGVAYCVLRIAYCVLRIAYCVLCIAYCTSVGSHAFLSLGRWTPGWGGTGAPSWAPVPTQPGVQLTSACIFGPRRENTAPDYIYCAQRNSFRPVASHAYSYLWQYPHFFAAGANFFASGSTCGEPSILQNTQYVIRNTQYAMGPKAPIRNT